jgi:TPR repeat protein
VGLEEDTAAAAHWLARAASLGHPPAQYQVRAARDCELKLWWEHMQRALRRGVVLPINLVPPPSLSFFSRRLVDELAGLTYPVSWGGGEAARECGQARCKLERPPDWRVVIPPH